MAMGGTGVSNGNPEFINIQNPALLHINKFQNLDSTIQFTLLEAGFYGQLRRLSTQSTTQITNGFNINYLSFAFTIYKRLTSSIGLRPYSYMQNRYVATLNNEQVKDRNIISAVNDYSINGSLNQVHFASGLDISKKFSIGLLASYIFGNITEQSVTQALLMQDGSFSANTGSNIHTYYSGLQLKPGISFRTVLKDSLNNASGTFFNAGFTVDYLTNFTGERSLKLISKNNYDAINTLSDTVNSTYKLTIPPTSSFGISLDRPDDWTIALDFNYAPWSYFNSFPNSYAKTQMNNSYTIALGGEIKPAKTKSLMNKEYRVGISYTKSPITVNNIQLDDYALTFGASFPLGRKDGRFKSKPLTKINAAMVVGNRGTTQGGLIREQYFRIHLGVLIHDKWFQRWRIE